VLQSRLTSQIYPHFGDLPVNSVKAATVRDWLGVLDEKKLSQNYKTVSSSHERARLAVDGIFGLKAADGLEVA